MTAETTLQSTQRRAAPRFERLVVIVALIGLAITGLPQKFATEAWAHTLFTLLGGIESARILHRFFALLLIAEAVYHVLAFLYRRIVLRARPAGQNALVGAIQRLLSNLGLRRDTPDAHFALRIEYWVIVISAVLMILTGLALWKPVAVTNVLPATTIPLFRSLHSDHALALVVFLVLWRIGMALLWRPKRDDNPPIPTASSAEIAAQRTIFIPVALVAAGMLTVTLGIFLASMHTAITTVVPREEAIFAPQSMPETGDPTVGSALWHTLRCAFCHGAEATGGIEGQPALLHTDLPFDAFYEQVREGGGDMPAFSAEDLPDAYVTHLYTWLTQPVE